MAYHHPTHMTQNPVFTGVVTLPPGTVATPGVQFSDTDATGLCQTSAGTLSVAVGGSEALRAVAAAAATNRLEAVPAAAGTGPTLAAQGADGTINLRLAAKGTAGRVQALSPLQVGGGSFDGRALVLSHSNSTEDFVVNLYNNVFTIQRQVKGTGTYIANPFYLEAAPANTIYGDSSGRVAFGGTPVERATVYGVTAMQYQSSAPSASANFGKLYWKSDGKLYARNAAGTETCLTP